MDEYFCTKCGAILNDQSGFDPDDSYWTCTSCGQMLYGDEINDEDTYPGVIWVCDSCGALLTKPKILNGIISTLVLRDLPEIVMRRSRMEISGKSRGGAHAAAPSVLSAKAE